MTKKLKPPRADDVAQDVIDGVARVLLRDRDHDGAKALVGSVACTPENRCKPCRRNGVG